MTFEKTVGTSWFMLVTSGASWFILVASGAARSDGFLPSPEFTAWDGLCVSSFLVSLFQDTFLPGIHCLERIVCILFPCSSLSGYLFPRNSLSKAGCVYPLSLFLSFRIPFPQEITVWNGLSVSCFLDPLFQDTFPDEKYCVSRNYCFLFL